MSTDNNKLSLKVISSPQVADDHSTIEADATAYIDNGETISYPDPPVEIIFELPQGMGAIFDDTKTTTTSRNTLTGSGRIETPVYFYSDKAIEDGMLTAYWKDDKENTLQQKSFTFTAADDYQLTFNPPLSNDQVAGRGTPDEGQLVVTDKNGPLPAPVVVKFEFSSPTSAQFVLSGDSNIIQDGSSTTVLLVQTHSENGQDIANASFNDAKAEDVTLKASLRDFTKVTPATQGFTFKAANQLHTIDIFPLLDNAPPDNNKYSQNRVLIAVMGKDRQVDTTYSGPVIFTITGLSAAFVGLAPGKPLTVSARAGFADASFVSDVAGNGTVIAALGDNSASSPPQGFTFTPNGIDNITWEGSPYSQEINSQLTATCLMRDDSRDVYFGLTANSASFFVKEKLAPSVTFVNAKFCIAHPSYTTLSVVLNCYAAENDIELTANMPGTDYSSQIANVSYVLPPS